MPDNEDDESWQLIQELRDKIESLRSDKSDLQDRVEELQRDFDSEESDNDELRQQIEELENTKEGIIWKFRESFEYYHTIWLDDTKDSQLIARMKEIYNEFKHDL